MHTAQRSAALLILLVAHAHAQTLTTAAPLTCNGASGCSMAEDASLAMSIDPAGGLVAGENGLGIAVVTNDMLAHPSVTVSAGVGLSGGGAVPLGGSVTLANAGVTSIAAGSGLAISGSTGDLAIRGGGFGEVPLPTVGQITIADGATHDLTAPIYLGNNATTALSCTAPVRWFSTWAGTPGYPPSQRWAYINLSWTVGPNGSIQNFSNARSFTLSGGTSPLPPTLTLSAQNCGSNPPCIKFVTTGAGGGSSTTFNQLSGSFTCNGTP